MPKIVDHQAYRKELAQKAVEIFTEHGFNGLGMRGIAEALGISKSALYHYFSSKEELFKASTEMFLEPSSLYGLAEGEAIPESNEQLLTKLITAMDARYRGEVTLMLEYTKNKDAQQVSDDNLLTFANQMFKSELANIVGEEKVDQAYALLFGGLMMRLLDGNKTEIASIAEWILALSTER
ncbi:TetR/AcrR family transcriptional regulator [Vibrio fluminensis]|uniref:TetR/AcrR family transcriptional regulator n=1 Tax=Vibrio fluminensis TaxID=2783614 RepID=UPI0018876E2A|nr:TetR/AcrR family transcriptional regulator [Vibrio fluminensis]